MGQVNDAQNQFAQWQNANNWPWYDQWGCMVLDEVKELMELTKEERESRITSGDWECAKVCPDSGAVKFVGPKTMCKHIEVKESAGSKKGVKYRAANGGLLPNLGQKVITSEDSNGNRLESTWQIADVTKPLAGIREMVKANNRVTFDQTREGKCSSTIYNKDTGVVIPINDVNDAYEFEMWVKKTQGSMDVGQFQLETGNKYQELEENDEPDTPVKLGESAFHRLVNAL